MQSLLLLPSETEIISDSIYANSQTLDGRRFADEFVRRRKLADKGVLQDGSGTPGSAGAAAAAGAGAGEGAGKGVGGFAGGAGAGNGGAAAAVGAGGWSEVAKKGPAGAGGKDDAGSTAFKVVAAKKKGKR